MDIAIKIMYISAWCIFAFIYFKLLRAIKIERAFPQGKVMEIRVTYVLLIFILSFLTTEGLFKLIEILVPNFN